MKKVIILFILVTTICSSSNAQTSAKSKTKQRNAANDKYANQEVGYKSKSAKPVNKTKLDDLKNPFDTSKKIKTPQTIKN
jgi:hypothetical protein